MPQRLILGDSPQVGRWGQRKSTEESREDVQVLDTPLGAPSPLARRRVW